MLKIKLPKEAELPKEQQQKHVIKITAGTKYYIGRSSNFSFVDAELRKVYTRYKYRNGIPEENQYYKLVKYLVDKNIDTLVVEILYTSDSGYAVMKEELSQLEQWYGKRDCLNQNSTPHVPKFKTDARPNCWLTHNEYLNFMKLLKTRQQLYQS